MRSIYSMSLFVVAMAMGGCGSMQLGGVRVTHGPMLGGPAATSMQVWARTSEPGHFRVLYGTEHGRPTGLVQSKRTSFDHDLTGVVTLDNLKPGTTYHYQVEPGSGKTLRGSFRTLPTAASSKNTKFNPNGLFNFSFEYACGNNQNPAGGLGPSLPTYNTLLRDVRGKVDFAILNGDWLYEDMRDYPPASWRRDVKIGDQASPAVVEAMPNIVGVWQNYKVYHERAKNLNEWHRHVPSIYTFDDHELLNDLYGSGTTGFRHRRAVFRDIGVRAWFDYLGWANPMTHKQPMHFGRAQLKAGSDILIDPNADFTKIDLKQAANLHVHWGTADAGVMKIEKGDMEGGVPNSKVYEIAEVLGPKKLRIKPAAVATAINGYSIGRRSYGTFKVSNCRFFVLDTRTHRLVHDLKNPAKKGVSMLGVQQREWLLREMAKGDADFYFIVSSVNFSIPHVGGGGGAHIEKGVKDDAWTVFLDEREKLIDAWDKMKQPVFILTGDLHNSFAVKISDNVWEFASGPHNSVNHRPVDEGNRPANGPFKWGPREVDIRWSTIAMNDIPRPARMFPHFCVVQINNVFNNPKELGGTRLIAYPKPHVVFRYFDGLTGDFKYAETIHAAK
jgi:alkaline phosphatase D